MTTKSTSSEKYKVYPIRYLLLLLFILLSMSNSFHWVIYAIIESQAKQYYNVSTFWINSTSTIYMISYIIAIVPATFFLNRYGLRWSLIVGSTSNAVGAFVKCFSLDRTGFVIAMIGQTIIASAQLFILNIPPVLSATWFATEEVTIATAYGVFGNQLGIVIGFFLPPLLMPELSSSSNTTTTTATNPTDESIAIELSPAEIDQIKQGLKWLTWPTTVITVAIALLIILFFQDKPPVAPSKAQDLLRKAEKESYFDSMKQLFTNSNFNLIFISYGLNVGICYAISTVLGSLVVTTMGNEYKNDAGFMGSLLIISGIFGSIICGYILGYSGKFKLVTIITYLFSMIGCLIFAIVLKLKSLLIMYAVTILLGFFMAGYLPIGFEFAAEISYPQPEGISAGLLNTSAQIFGIILTYLAGLLIDEIGPFWLNILFTIILFIGTLLTMMVTNDLRRQDAQNAIKLIKSNLKSKI